MEEIYRWVRSLVCYMCFFQVILHVIPGQKFQKYVKFFGNLILVLLVVSPFADVGNVTDRFEDAWRLESRKEELFDIRIAQREMEEVRMEKLDEAYRMELKKQHINGSE